MMTDCRRKLSGHDFLREGVKWFWIYFEEIQIKNIFRFVKIISLEIVIKSGSRGTKIYNKNSLYYEILF